MNAVEMAAELWVPERSRFQGFSAVRDARPPMPVNG